MLGALVAKLGLGADHAEIIAGDEVAIDAQLIVDVDDVEIVGLDLGTVGPDAANFEPEISRIVARHGRRRQCSDRGGREQMPSHA